MIFFSNSLCCIWQEHFVVDEGEQRIDNFAIPLSLQYGLDTVEEDTPSVTLVFLNIAPMIMKEQNRKAGEKANQPTVTTLMSHFRLLRNTIDSFEQVRSVQDPTDNIFLTSANLIVVLFVRQALKISTHCWDAQSAYLRMMHLKVLGKWQSQKKT